MIISRKKPIIIPTTAPKKSFNTVVITPNSSFCSSFFHFFAFFRFYCTTLQRFRKIQISGNLGKNLEENEVIVSSPYIATIKELSVFNLDTDVSIDSKVYVPQNVRVEKKSIQEEKGCSSSINDGLLVFLVLGIIGGAIMTIKRRRLNE